MKDMQDDNQIEQLLQEIGRISPPKNALIRGKNTVMAQVRQDDSRRLMVKEQSTRAPIARALTIKRFNYMPIIALILAVVLGGGGTVAAAQNDLPGDALYKVKLASEAVAEATVTAGGAAAELNFKAKLASRRAEELQALKENLAAVKEDQKSEVEARITQTAQLLAARVEKMDEQIERLAQKDQPRAAEAATRLAAYAEIMQGVIAGLQEFEFEASRPEFSEEFSERAVGLEVALAKLKIKSEVAQEEVLGRHASKTGLENAAQGRVGAAENKQNAVEKMREQALRKIPRIEDAEMLAFAKAEFERRDAFYRDGAEKTAQARKELEQGNFEAAIKLAGEAFKLFTQFESPLSKDVERFKLKEEDEAFKKGLLMRFETPIVPPAALRAEAGVSVEKDDFAEAEGEIIFKEEGVIMIAPAPEAPEPSVAVSPMPEPSVIADKDEEQDGKPPLNLPLVKGEKEIDKNGMDEKKKSATPSAEELKMALKKAWEFYLIAAGQQSRMKAKDMAADDSENTLHAAKVLLLRAEDLQARGEIGAAKEAMRSAVEMIEKVF